MLKDNSESTNDSLLDSLDPRGGVLTSLASLNFVKERISSHKNEILFSELLFTCTLKFDDISSNFTNVFLALLLPWPQANSIIKMQVCLAGIIKVQMYIAGLSVDMLISA